MPTFRAKARAIDLLGKGQISDLPTAISELWKNGYDAYGDTLEAFLYLNGYEDIADPLFVISDDGKGMSRADILEKWIVLGTDSKSRSLSDTKGEDTLNKEPRIKMGEKGIGRLSVAYLGTPMLMMTKKIGHPLQVLFIDWRILTNYNMYIEDINIPIKSISNSDDFSSVFNDLKKEFLENFAEKHDDDGKLIDFWGEQPHIKNDIIRDVSQITLPSFFKSEIIQPYFENSANTHGTKFIIFKPDEQLLALTKSNNDENQEYYDETINEIRSSLNGLFNVFKKENLGLKTNFIVVSKTGKRDLISSREFFSPEDFDIADHLIDGKFEKDGTFNGNIRIYKKEISHTFRANRRTGNTPYGNFNIKIGVIPGYESESLLNKEQLAVFDKKLESFGGLYIYRDGFRVLPYGRLEEDFLRFEWRRSKNAGNYFFSHRRMFGYIEITRESNRNLYDKAGREGFVNNVGYREFKTDLESFFIDLAKKYFGTNAESDIKNTQKDELKAASKNEKDEHEKEKELRKEYSKTLVNNLALLNKFENEYEELINKLSNAQSQTELLFSDIEDLLKRIEDCKTNLKKIEMQKPVRFSLTELQQKKLFNYNNQYSNFQNNKIKKSEDTINQAREKLKDLELIKEFDAKYRQYKSSLSNIYDEAIVKIEDSTHKLKEKVQVEKNNSIKDLEDKYLHIKPNYLDRKDILQSISLLENISVDIYEKGTKKTSPLLKHLNRLSLDIDEEALTGYYKLRYQDILNQWNQTKELAQMGISLEIIDHQFHDLYSQVSYAITQMKDFISNDEKALKNYKSLKISFEHLEDRYKLTSPLYRTAGRIRRDIFGKDIIEYLNSFFSTQFTERKIELKHSSTFEKMYVLAYESILYPAIVNVVNNAIFWLTSVPNRSIYIDFVDDSKILIANSGTSIEDFYLEEIFKLFYSKKPNGRGIGLFLAKETLQSIGFDMYATNELKYNKLGGACFVIETKPTQSSNLE